MNRLKGAAHTMRKSLLVPAVMAAGLVAAPLAYADSGDQSDANEAVAAIYNQVQRGCTPNMAPSIQSITWDNFYPAVGGSGRIHDANSSLGGPFKVLYTNAKVGPAHSFTGDDGAYRAYGQWSVNLEFC
jgi:hypothetical protein